VENDSFNLLNSLLEKKVNDSGWVVEYQLDPVSQALTHLLWMEPQQVGLVIKRHFIYSYVLLQHEG